MQCRLQLLVVCAVVALIAFITFALVPTSVGTGPWPSGPGEGGAGGSNSGSSRGGVSSSGGDVTEGGDVVSGVPAQPPAGPTDDAPDPPPVAVVDKGGANVASGGAAGPGRAFDPSSPIYVSITVNASYRGNRIVVPFAFRPQFLASRSQQAASARSHSNSSVAATPNEDIRTGQALATRFFEHWQRLGRRPSFAQIPFKEVGAPFFIENVRAKLRIHIPQLRVRPLLKQVVDRDAEMKGVAGWVPLLPAGHKRLILDLGARQFPGSPMWFAKSYPEAKTFDFVAFELLDLKDGYKGAGAYFKSVRYIQKAAWMHDRGVQISGVRMAKVVDDSSSGDKGGNTGASSPSAVAAALPPPKGGGPKMWNAPSIDIAAFLRAEASPSDFVVLKIDIEGGEWPLLQYMVKERVIPDLIDEIMMECHAKDPQVYVSTGFRVLPQECMDLIADLRDMGVYTHRWV